MACTTLLVGRLASFDGSTIIARNEDSPSGEFEPKRLAVVAPGEQPRCYTATASALAIRLPENPVRYTSVPNAIADRGVWGSAGVNECNVAMSATETITSNERVLGADPLVRRAPAVGAPGEPGYVAEQVGGLGEEDLLTVILPYIASAREGVLRTGELLERYGTYEMNGIAFSDIDEIWWLETVGGHHWIARRVPDDAYVTMPNQLGIDSFDLNDAEGEGREHLASGDLRAWMAANHLDLSMPTADLAGFIAVEQGGPHVADVFNPRLAFGSHEVRDHVYNTPRAWYMQRCFNPSGSWDGPDAALRPDSDAIPWARAPDSAITIEDVKRVLSAHYEDTPFDPYGVRGTEATRSMFRPIGINRNCQLAVIQLRPYAGEGHRAVQWMAFGSNPFNALVALYAGVDAAPAYLANTTARVSTESFYWANRIIAALADGHVDACAEAIEAYQQRIGALGHQMLRETDRCVSELSTNRVSAALERANERMCETLRRETEALLAQVLHIASLRMRNGFARSDA